MRVCVFCGSNEGRRPEYAEAARALGAELARRKIPLVFGGGRVGLMGQVAEATLAGGGEAIGIITRGLMDREVGHTGLTQLHVVETMHERKAMMASLAEAFVVLPGGIGTMEEFFEVWTWGYLGIHAKPFGLLDVQGFYQRLSAALDHLVDEGFLKPQTRQMVITESAPTMMLDRLLAAHPAPSAPAITPEET